MERKSDFAKNLNYWAQFWDFARSIRECEPPKGQAAPYWEALLLNETVERNLDAYPGQFAEA